MCVAVRVLMLSWEYPPLVVGGLGRHVGALAGELAGQGHDVCVITRGDGPRITTSVEAGVRVVRAATDPLDIEFTTESLLAWAQASEHSVLRAALPVVRQWRPDVVHAHDWLVAQSSTTVAAACRVPLVTTIHATEAGRHQGNLPHPLNRAIHSVERWLTRASTQVITCSDGMRAEVLGLFDLADDQVSVVPNGIDPMSWLSTPGLRTAVRSQLGVDGPLLVFAGRLVHEKGVQTLLAALRPLRAVHPDLRLAVAGTGIHEAALRAQARRLRIVRAVDWLGFLDEHELAVLLGAADLVVVPSLYEPFGLVALEAAAAGAPLVVAETGGLADLLSAGIPAASFAPGDAAALATEIMTLLDDPSTVRIAAIRARRLVRAGHSWATIATLTSEIYRRVAADLTAASAAEISEPR